MLSCLPMGGNTKKQRIGLVLSGGGARGFAHIGVMRVLEQAGVEADVVAGTSMGAILGALHASGRSADEIYQLAVNTSWRDVFDLSLQAGLIKGEKFHAFLAELLPPRFADLQKPLVVTTTDIESGEEVLILEGDLVKAVRASSCFPGAFEPVEFNGRTLADGGIVNNLPVNAAAVLHATYTIASDATPPRRAAFREPHEEGRWWERMIATVKLERRNPMAQMLLRSSDIMQSILTDIQYNLHPADVRVQLDMPHIRVESFWSFEEIVQLGEEAAVRAFSAAGLLPGGDKPETIAAPASHPTPPPMEASARAKRRLGFKRS
jgi:NTE family protein